MYKSVFIGIGSNIGDRRTNIIEAIKRIRRNPRIRLSRISSIYKTEPMYNEKLPEFYNAVIEIETELEPEELLDFLKRIEVEMGRDLDRNERYEPRPMDLDIISFQDIILNTEKLTIPHKNMWERKFVLIPLQEIAPDYICPKTKLKISDLIKRIGKQDKRVERAGSIDMREL